MNKLNQQSTQWLNYLSNVVNLSDKTISSYSSDMSVFLKYCKSINITEVSQLTLSHLHGFIESKTSTNANSTINRRTACLKNFFDYMVEVGEVNENIATNIKSRKLKKSIPKSLSLEEAKELIECGKQKGMRDGLIVEMLLLTGLRSFELANIKECDIKNGILLVTEGKGDKQREIPIDDYLLSRIEEYKSYKRRCDYITDNTYLFISRLGKPITENTVQKLIKGLMTEIGREDLSCHKTRSTFASMLNDAGVSITTIQQLLGHSVVTTSMKYISVTKESMRRAVSANPLSC